MVELGRNHKKTVNLSREMETGQELQTKKTPGKQLLTLLFQKRNTRNVKSKERCCKAKKESGNRTKVIGKM